MKLKYSTSVDIIKFRPEPAWKDRVERWYQLDENGYVICEAVYDWLRKDKMHKFDALLLVLPEASNLADLDFVSSTPASPAKFVYTLPNIAGVLVAQMTSFHGPIFCLCEDPDSQKITLFAQSLLLAGHKKVFVLESSLALNSTKERVVTGYFWG